MKSLNVPAFSIVIIARNEAHTLARLARSIARFLKRGGDAVLVDTGSTDDTARVAQAAGLRVVRARSRFYSKLTATQADEINARFGVAGEGPLVRAGIRMFHFGNARQFAAAQAANDMVLFLDACDTVRTLDTDFLSAQIQAGGTQRFRFVRELGSARNRTGGGSFRTNWFYDRRLWRWEGMCHEVLAAQSAEAELARKLDCEPAQLLTRHLKDSQKKRDHYLPALALNALAQPENPRWQHYLGRELYYAHHYRSALALLERHAASGAGWVAERSESWCLAGACYEALGERTAAANVFQSAAALDASRREPLLRLAALAQAQGDFEASAHHASAALAIPYTAHFYEPDANYSYLPHAYLYWALFWLGRKTEAKKHWEQCITLLPRDKRFRADAKLFGVQL